MSEPVEAITNNPTKDKAAKIASFLNKLEKCISYLVLLFCFIFFPGYFMHSSLTLFFKNDADNLRQEKLIEMNEALEYMEKYSNNKKYFHYLLSKISELAQKSENPADYLKTNINNIKTKYPNCLEFIVWNEDGKLNKELSDKASYGYVLGKLYETIKEVQAAVKKDASARVTNLTIVKKNTNLIRNFLGRIFIPENLKYPILDNQNAGPILTEIGDGFTNCWYSIGKKISFFCFLAKPIIDDYSGLNKIIKSLNSQGFDIIAGFSVSADYVKSVTPISEIYEPDLSLALSTFENAGDSVFENDRVLIKMAMPQPDVRTYVLLPKLNDVWDYNYKTNIWFGVYFSCLLLAYGFWMFWYLYKHNFFSIRWKLTALFLFANLIPISIVGFIAKGYLNNKRLSLKSEIIGDLEKKLREFDIRYLSQMEDYKFRINKLIDPISEKIGNNIIQEDEINSLRAVFKEFNCSEMCLIASDSKIIDSLRDSSLTTQNIDFMSSLANAILKYVNLKIERNKNDNDIFSSIVNLEGSDLVKQSLKNFRNISEMVIGEYSKIYYMRLFGDTDNYNNNYFYQLCWDRGIFQDLFIKKSFNSIKTGFPEALFYITSSDITNGLQNNKNLSSDLLSIFEKNSGMTEITSGSIIFNKKPYLYVCLNANHMRGQVMLGLYPERIIDTKINIIIIQLVMGALISLLLTIIIGHILSLQFLKPIKNLGEAAVAIGNRNFQYRLPPGDKDEFGHLNQVFNHAIEGLEDFEVARIVQESLFPGNNFDVGDFNIFGRSVVMTTLGGDYYDCFKINDEYQGIIIGDVAGHGIPAGLMMAMAKSGVLSASEDIKLDAAVLTARLHKILHAIKNEKLKRMMTFMYFVLRVSDGHFTYTNAGHCFPVIVDSNKKTAEFLEYIATPLGIGARCRCKNQEFVLEKGQSLILYTDGIVEANNANGEQYGYDRFKESLLKHYDPNPEVFYYNIYNKVYKVWSEKPDDDLTFIFVNRN